MQDFLFLVIAGAIIAWLVLEGIKNSRTGNNIPQTIIPKRPSENVGISLKSRQISEKPQIVKKTQVIEKPKIIEKPWATLRRSTVQICSPAPEKSRVQGISA